MQHKKTQERIHTIKLEDIKPPQDDVREQIDPATLTELAQSLRELGQLTPIVLRAPGPPHEISQGHRRYLAAKIAGLTHLKATFVDVDDETNYTLRAVENLQREDLNTLEEAKIYNTMRTKYGLTIKQIAQKVGRSETHIQNILKALELPDFAQQALRRREITWNALRPLFQIEEEDLRTYYMQYACANGATRQTTQNWVNSYKQQKIKEHKEQHAVIIHTTDNKRTIYMQCAACRQPADVQTMRMIHLCDRCARYIIDGQEIDTQGAVT